MWHKIMEKYWHLKTEIYMKQYLTNGLQNSLTHSSSDTNIDSIYEIFYFQYVCIKFFLLSIFYISKYVIRPFRSV